MSALGLPGGGRVEMILLGNVFYMKLPAEALSGEPQLLARPWLKVDLATLSQQSGVNLEALGQLRDNDPTAALNFLRGVSNDVKKVGSEKVRGAETTHYSATADLNKTVEQVPADLRDDITRLIGQLGTSTIPTEAWVDDDGRLRRMRYIVDLSRVQAGGQPAPLGGVLTTTIEAFDFGADVDVSEPPADQVTDFAALMSQLP
jgi:hypothetical protein